MNNKLAIRTVLTVEPQRNGIRSILSGAPLMARPKTQDLVPRLSPALVPLKRSPQPCAQPVQLRDPEEVSVLHETAGPIDLTLPFGWETRHVNAATFKALAGRSRDNLFRRSGPIWQIVENSELIDLADKSVVYKLGPVQIFS